MEDSENTPLCFCHGNRAEEPNQITEKNASDCGCEWAYVFAKDRPVMYVLSSYCEDGEKMIGAFGMGDPNATWKCVTEVDLEGEEPDWDKIEDF